TYDVHRYCNDLLDHLVGDGKQPRREAEASWDTTQKKCRCDGHNYDFGCDRQKRPPARTPCNDRHFATHGEHSEACQRTRPQPTEINHRFSIGVAIYLSPDLQGIFREGREGRAARPCAAGGDTNILKAAVVLNGENRRRPARASSVSCLIAL